MVEEGWPLPLDQPCGGHVRPEFFFFFFSEFNP